MALGCGLWPEQLVLTRGRGFEDAVQWRDADGGPLDYPAGWRVWVEILTDPVTVWEYSISGSTAVLGVSAVDVARVPAFAKWQLVVSEGGGSGRAMRLGSVVFQP